MYDVIIIGAGPAGISASLYVKRANLKVLVLHYGETSLKNAKIDNYYGFPKGIDGDMLYLQGIEQAKNLDIEVKKTEVFGIENLDKVFKVKTAGGDIETKAVIIATGNKKIKPDIPGILEFEGKGISYCAICDAFFYRKKDVAIIGNGKFAANEAKYLANIANKVTILTNGLEAQKCDLEINTKKIKKIIGEIKVNKIEFEDGSFLNVDGVFIALGEAGAEDFAKSLGIIQQDKNIEVNENMQTNIKGIFACGNVTGGLLQVTKAVYEGAKAGLSVAEYIRKEKSNG